MDSVALVRYKQDIGESIEEGLNLIGGFRDLKSPVLIKPNICTISDATGHSVTDVKTVDACIDLLLKENEELSIKIIESDSQSKFTEEAFKKFGFADLVTEKKSIGYDISLVNLSKAKCVKIDLQGAYFDTLEIPALLAEPHYYISVAIAKTHESTFLTGSLKNQFGLLPRKDMSFYHSRIDDVIVDMNRFIEPDLLIIDGRYGVEGWNGPKTRKLDAVIVGYQPVSVDSVLTRIMGFAPSNIPHLIKASKHDLGTLVPKVLGESIESLVVNFESPKRPS